VRVERGPPVGFPEPAAAAGTRHYNGVVAPTTRAGWHPHAGGPDTLGSTAHVSPDPAGGDAEPTDTAADGDATERMRRDLLARFFRALGDPTRLALLEYCADRERTGSECVAHVGLSQGRVSSHLACLVDCGALRVRRAGRYAYYHRDDARLAVLLGLASEVVADHAATIAACTRVATASG